MLFFEERKKERKKEKKCTSGLAGPQEPEGNLIRVIRVIRVRIKIRIKIKVALR